MTGQAWRMVTIRGCAQRELIVGDIEVSAYCHVGRANEDGLSVAVSHRMPNGVGWCGRSFERIGHTHAGRGWQDRVLKILEDARGRGFSHDPAVCPVCQKYPA